MNSIRISVLVSMLMGLVSHQSVDAAEINWSGFLSGVAGKTLEQDTEYNTGFTGFQYGRYENHLTYEQESIIGLQGQILVRDNIRATVQLVGRGGINSYVNAEWAYLTFELSDSFNLNVGRFRLPMYYFSEYFEIGKAYYWIRPPAEVYVNPNSLYGVNLDYLNTAGDFEIKVQTWSGSNSVSINDNTRLKYYDNYGISAAIGKDGWNLRAVYNESDFEFFIDGNLLGMANLKFYALSFVADWQEFLVRSEYTEFKRSGFDDTHIWYASTGYRFGALTPHLTYTEADEYVDIPQSSTITLGLAWDLNINTALKIEYLDRNPDDVNLKDVKLIAFGVDLVF